MYSSAAESVVALRRNLELGARNLEGYDGEHGRRELTAKLRETADLAGSHGVDADGLQAFRLISEDGDVWIDESDKAGSDISTTQYAGGKRSRKARIPQATFQRVPPGKRGVDGSKT